MVRFNTLYIYIVMHFYIKELLVTDVYYNRKVVLIEVELIGSTDKVLLYTYDILYSSPHTYTPYDRYDRG